MSSVAIVNAIDFYCVICGKRHSARAADAGGLLECPRCWCMVPIPGFPGGPQGSAGCVEAFPASILAIEMVFRCEHCRKKLQVDARWHGMTMECPLCCALTRIPRWSGDLPPAPKVESVSSGVERHAHLHLSSQEFEYLSSRPVRQTRRIARNGV